MGFIRGFCPLAGRGIANREGHSVAQICEAFLLAGSEGYKKQGSKFVKRVLARLITRSTADRSALATILTSKTFDLRRLPLHMMYAAYIPGS